MARRGERDRNKERFWRGLLRAWRRSGQSVRAFCGEHELSEPSFYGWRRTIAARDRQATHRQQSDGNYRRARSARKERNGNHTPVFVPIRVAPTVAALEVVLRDGRVVRVPAGFDATMLRQLLAVLTEAPPC